VKRDVQATEAKHFVDPRSYVSKDGREVLYKEDWLARVVELDKRCGGRCEDLNTFRMRCPAKAAHPHHIIKRSKGRDDRLKNLLALCNFHHSQRHPEFYTRWSKR
jgi:hypothetical protein